MLGSILIGLDGSPYSKNAVELAISWAKPTQATIAAIVVLDEPPITQGEVVPVGGSSFKAHRDAMRMVEAQQKIEGFLEEFEKRCNKGGVSCKTIRESGPPSEEILKAAGEFDVIVLGQKTFFHFETDKAPCDTLVKVVRHSPRPVIAVPDTPVVGNSILVAYDDSLQASRALQMLQLVDLHKKTPVHILSIHKHLDEARAQTEKAAQFLRYHGIEPHTHPLASTTNPGELILQHAQQLHAGLLVMGAYGRPFLSEFFFGSATRTFLAERKIHLFLYH